MSAPYWGQLPAANARRMSEDYDRTNRRQSLDHSAPPPQQQQQHQHQHQHQPQSRSNRNSTQTTNTDTYTDSTFSPLTSPATSNFQAHALAPRPPSLPYGQNRFPPELVEARKRRSSRNQEDDSHESTTSPPPAAPDVPRAPPVSYRNPYEGGSSPQPYTYNTAGQPGPPRPSRKSDPHARIAAMEPEAFYKDATPPAERQNRAPMLDRTRPNFGQAEDMGRPTEWDSGRSVSIRRPANDTRPDKAVFDPASTPRRGSQTAESQRKKWADDRSPLQKLELTLDSITKEEKRARVEAAERRIREKAARAETAGDVVDRDRPQPERSGGQQVRFRDGHPSVHSEEKNRAIMADPIQAQPSAATTNGPLSRNGSSGPSPRSQIPVAKNRNVTPTEKNGLPRRNLSFRERAATNDRNLPREADSDSPVSPITTPGRTLSLTRSGSNKLKKNPPGDPWYSVRREAEEKSVAFNGRSPEAEEPEERGKNNTLNVMKTRPTGGTIKKKPPPPEEFERPPARGKNFQEYDETEESPSRMRGFAAAIGLGRSNSMGARRVSYGHEPQLRDEESPDYEDYNYDETPSRRRGFTAATGLGRANSMGVSRQPAPHGEEPRLTNNGGGNGTKSVTFPDQPHEARVFDDDLSDDGSQGYGFREYMHRDKLKPGQGMYQPPNYLDEWRKGTVGTLSGSLLDISREPQPAADTNAAWWEGGDSRKNSLSRRPQKAEAFDGEYDDTQTPTRFKPPLYLKCGPLLRYCGIRHEKPITRTSRNGVPPDREIWRGSVMIVTQDSESSYEIAPMLRLFVQPIELLPPPPAELRGEQALLPEYVDPIAGIPKLGRRGESLYVRPVEHLEEGKDASMLEPDDGLFEITRSAPDFNKNAPDPPGSFASRKRRIEVDGEKVGKYKDVRGFRLHTERGHTFWRFNIEIELRDKEQRIAYRINRGPATGFWVPARDQSMNVMFHSCNGFSLSVDPDDLSGPDPMWRDVLNNHQTRPFHVMIGGGDQVYNDAIMRKARHFQDWLEIKNPLHKNNAPFTSHMQDEMEEFYLERYMMWFSQGLFGLANSQIPMVNMYDDHDIIDGFGSYPHHFMKSPVFSGLGNVAFKYYMLFQHQSLPEESEQSEPSWILGPKPGPYINELSRSVFLSLGSRVALLAVDCRTERTRDEVLREDTWEKIKDRCYDEIVKGKTQHLLVLLGVPVAYPRLVWLENILTSRLMDPIKALGKAGMLGNLLNRFDGGVEVLDDLDDHWTAKNHKEERKIVIEDLQDLAADKSIRVTMLSGDVHLAAIGQFYSHPKLNLAKHKDFRYMPNIISSAIANTPPPDLMADVLNKRNKVHHFDKDTEEDMIPIFTNGVDGKPRNNKRLLPHRNWCSIREYTPGYTPPPTPPSEDYDPTPEGTPPASRAGLFRRFSLSKSRGPALRPDAPRDTADRSRPPVSGGFMRSFSRRGSSSEPTGRPRPGKLARTLSLGRGDSFRRRNIFRRASTEAHKRPDDGGINGDWGADSEEDIYDAPPPQRIRPAAFQSNAGHGEPTLGLRGGASNEYEVGDDSYFTARPPRRAFTQPAAGPSYNRDRNAARDGNEYDYTPESETYTPPAPASVPVPAPAPRPFHRTPTGLSVKQAKRGVERYEVDLEGGLDICLNVEVNAKDPAGITVPYRLLVPRLWYEYQGEHGEPEDEGDEEEDHEPEPISPDNMRPERGQTYAEGHFRGEEQGDGGEGKGGGGGGLKRWFSGRGSQYRARRS